MFSEHLPHRGLPVSQCDDTPAGISPALIKDPRHRHSGETCCDATAFARGSHHSSGGPGRSVNGRVSRDDHAFLGKEYEICNQHNHDGFVLLTREHGVLGPVAVRLPFRSRRSGQSEVSPRRTSGDPRQRNRPTTAYADVQSTCDSADQDTRGPG